VVLLLAHTVAARQGVVTDHVRLREGPNAETGQVGTLPPGTRVEILSDQGGWREIRTLDGRAGFVRAEYLAEGRRGEAGAPASEPEPSAPTEPASPAPVARLEPPPRPGPPPTPTDENLLNEIKGLRADVAALRERVESAATAADIERLRADVERLQGTPRQASEVQRVPAGPSSDTEARERAWGIVLLVGGAVTLLGGVLLAWRAIGRRNGSRIKF